MKSLQLITRSLAAIVAAAIPALQAADFPTSPLPAKTYTYDALSRLTKVSYPDGRYASYQYDAAGNLTSVLSVFAGNDTNDNSVPDSWEIRYFGNIAQIGAGADSNHNQIPDFLEFCLAASPCRRHAENLPTAQILEADGEKYLYFTYRRNLQAGNQQFILEGSEDMSTWYSGPEWFQEVGRLDNLDGSEIVTVRTKRSLVWYSSLFLRLRITRSDIP